VTFALVLILIAAKNTVAPRGPASAHRDAASAEQLEFHGDI
jgi:hypothetical protein